MNKNIKQDILITAKELFQVEGYNNVSMRDIAAALDISVGNLTYHYKKKEDLVEAVVIEQHKNYIKPVPVQSIRELYDFLYNHVRLRQKLGYYFRHYIQLAQISPKVYEIQITAMSDMRKALQGSFSYFLEAGLVKEKFDGQAETTVHTLMALCTHGMEYYERFLDDAVLEELMKSVLHVLSGIVTEKGIREIKKITNKDCLNEF